MEVENGAVQVVFDPDILPQSNVKASVKFQDSTSLSARIVFLSRIIETLKQPFATAYEAHLKADDNSNKFKYDPSLELSELENLIEREQNGLSREYLLLNYFQISPLLNDSKMALRVFNEISPKSPAWSLVWPSPANTFSTIARMAKQPNIAKLYVQRVITSHADPKVRADFLLFASDQAQLSPPEINFEGINLTKHWLKFLK